MQLVSIQKGIWNTTYLSRGQGSTSSFKASEFVLPSPTGLPSLHYVRICCVHVSIHVNLLFELEMVQGLESRLLLLIELDSLNLNGQNRWQFAYCRILKSLRSVNVNLLLIEGSVQSCVDVFQT